MWEYRVSGDALMKMTETPVAISGTHIILRSHHLLPGSKSKPAHICTTWPPDSHTHGNQVSPGGTVSLFRADSATCRPIVYVVNQFGLC